MAALPKSLLWSRLDTTGTEHAVLDDRSGLYARGNAIAADPLPHTIRYSLQVDEGWATVRFEVTSEGAGWVRSVKLARAAGRWHVTASEQGDLDAALRAHGAAAVGQPGVSDADLLDAVLDVDLGGCPLTNTLPIRRLGLLDAEPGSEHTITAAWVLVPSLVIVPSEQTYTIIDKTHQRYSSGTFRADLTLDEHGYVEHYPAMATRVGTNRHR